MRDHTKLRAFELADQIALETYHATKSFPKEEQFGLVSQMRRAAVSVPSNIVEGCARESQNEYARFLEIAYASLRELGYQLSLSTRLEFLDTGNNEQLSKLCGECEKVLGALLRSQRK
ncbi:four helix bundle protein [Pelagicoccus mobilis]|uniref:Four helix bundle protein n=1 Tax=Pelagicoccus mobilis TaxID=415221 RepID=A0A934RZS1_9BACT|nr:four helix bundle protein [Pelagicoccus mobilis]MBK1876834.1 four helix bundle protein [Pelagicoccus mobilis]